MSLASLTDRFFDHFERTRGLTLFQNGKVLVQKATPTELEAEVLGGNLYEVRISKIDDGIEVHCDCPFFDTHYHCKHLWATILEAGRQIALGEVTRVVSMQPEGNPQAVPKSFWAPQPVRVPAWQEHLGNVERKLSAPHRRAAKSRPLEISYSIDVSASRTSGNLVIDVYSRTLKKDGEWTPYREFDATLERAAQLPDPVDIEVITALLGGESPYYSGIPASRTHKALPGPLAVKLLPIMSSTGRLFFRDSGASHLNPIAWDTGDPWIPWLEIRQDERDQWTITGILKRGDATMDLQDPLFLLQSGILLTPHTLARFDTTGGFAWISELREVKKIPFPDRERDAVLEKLLHLPTVPPIDIEGDMRYEERRATPKFGMRVRQERTQFQSSRYTAELLADYGAGWLDATTEGRGIWRPEDRVYLVRDHAAEDAARETLASFGLRLESASAHRWAVSTKSLPRVARQLIASGWHVEAEGKAFRTPGATRVSVTSGVDWFELHGDVDYGGTTVSLPQLLAAVRRGDNMVVLGDGTFGLLPEEWLDRFAPLANLGEKQDDHLRFRQNQALLLDAMLAAQPEVNRDEVFENVRGRMRNFEGVKPLDQPPGFRGQLRDYQREGLGWMQFLREFGFGGCLADDMGVGKTAQVLAVLEARRMEGEGPSLVVVPKSLMFNWREEAARFTPALRVLEYHGMARDASQMRDHDLVLTTYGTMLRDATTLAGIEFDYVVLDEAQAVKNADTASAKAVRLLRGKHRLALSGTPVENHLGELWSLFEFLNPGMLGEARVLQMSGGLARNPSEEARQLLAQALRPFILRRTKQQVARELPEKTEQTIFCELEGEQKKYYQELRDHYRQSLMDKVRNEGLGRAKMHVLEALLRLRQAACHPGLIDANKVDESSAKLEVLLDHLTEVREEGHKALVFSQFTSLLSIVRKRLHAAGMRYEYLDGATTNRQAHVETFQNDPECGLFLISLKAGGLGLNLTAAEYVFLLDPWWNPAVEAQAVDRAHRIGQTRPVFAYRLIARDTVEEKVLQLQKSKRDLADAILSEDNRLIRDLKSEDLELLLS